MRRAVRQIYVGCRGERVSRQSLSVCVTAVSVDACECRRRKKVMVS